MFFFPNLNQGEITFLVHQFTDEEAGIQFIRKQDTLLAVDFSVANQGITINQNIKGNYLAKPPFYPAQIDQLTEIKVKYHSDKSLIYLNFKYNEDKQLGQSGRENNTKTIKLNVKDFDHTLVVTIGILVSVLDNIGSLSGSQKEIYQEFLSDCQHLESFKIIAEQLKSKRLSKAKIADIIIEGHEGYKNHINKGRDKLNNNLNTILEMEKQITNQSNQIKKIIPDKIYVFPENQYSHGVSIIENGSLKHGDQIGKWIYHANRLFLFLDGKVIQLFVKNNLINDLNKLKWYSSLDQGDDNDNNSNRNGDNQNKDNRELQTNLDTTAFLSKNGQHLRWIVLIITCYKRLDKAKQIHETWVQALKKLGFVCLFVVGDPSKEKSVVQGDFLYVKCQDSYEALPSKVVNAYLYCYHHFNFTYLYKVDDDTVVNPLRLVELDLGNHHYIGKPQQITREFNRFWHRGKCQNKKLDKIPYPSQRIRLGAIYAKGEAGYFLSRYAVSKLISELDYINSDLYEDKVVGDVLYQHGIKLYNSPKYTTKLAENFPPTRHLDNFHVIMDCGNRIKGLYQNHFVDQVR